MATKMSKEEKAVRDALAAVLADTGVQQAQAAIASAPSNQAASTSGKISDIDTSTPLGKAAAEILGKAQTFVDKNTPTAPTAPTAPVVTPVVNQGLTATQIAEQQASKEAAAAALEKRQSAFDLLSAQFAQYGLQALVDPLKGLIQENISPSEFAVRLRQTDPYKKRFAANATRIANGLAALSEGEYIGLEDQYQNIMRNYGLPSTYYTKGDLGRQEGFEKLISYDVSAIELEDRISTAQKRVINAPPEVTAALKAFYPSITNADILAYTLDPTKGLDDIKRKITASEIGGAAMAQGLTTSLDATGQSLGAEALTKLGVTQAEAQKGFSNIASILPAAEKLSSIYGGEDYTRLQAEQEQFQQLASARRARESLTALETAQFSGSAGVGPAGLSTQMLRKSSSAGQY